MVGGQAHRQAPTPTGDGVDQHRERLEVDGIEEERDQRLAPTRRGQILSQPVAEFEPAHEQRGLVEAGIVEKAAEAFDPPTQALGRSGEGPGQVGEREIFALAQGTDHLGEVGLLGLAPGRREVLDKSKDLAVRYHQRRLRWLGLV